MKTSELRKLIRNELVNISKITEAETTSSTDESKHVLLMRSDNRHCFYKVMGFPKKKGDPVTFDNSKYKVAYVGKDKNDVLAFINTFKKRIFQMLDYNKL